MIFAITFDRMDELLSTKLPIEQANIRNVVFGVEFWECAPHPAPATLHPLRQAGQYLEFALNDSLFGKSRKGRDTLSIIFTDRHYESSESSRQKIYAFINFASEASDWPDAISTAVASAVNDWSNLTNIDETMLLDVISATVKMGHMYRFNLKKHVEIEGSDNTARVWVEARPFDVRIRAALNGGDGKSDFAEIVISPKLWFHNSQRRRPVSLVRHNDQIVLLTYGAGSFQRQAMLRCPA